MVLLIGLWAILGTWQDEARRGPCEQATIDLVEKTRVSVVNITTQVSSTDGLAMWSTSAGHRIGIHVERSEHLVTNCYVVADGSGAVRLSDEHDAQSSLVGVSTLADLCG